MRIHTLLITYILELQTVAMPKKEKERQWKEKKFKKGKWTKRKQFKDAARNPLRWLRPGWAPGAKLPVWGVGTRDFNARCACVFIKIILFIQLI